MEKQGAPVGIPEYLNEDGIALLESHWSDLPAQAYCESTNDGWKIHLRGKATLFEDVGFQDAEWIEPHALLHYAKTSEKKGLVERLLAILDHIKKEN